MMPRPVFDETYERKVHLFHDQQGATYGSCGHTKKYANTLCKGNFAGEGLQTTNDPEKVTCKICRKDRRFRELTQPVPAATVPAAKMVGGMRTRHRQNWRGKLILQVSEMKPYNFDQNDPYEIAPMGFREVWRDATIEDLGVGVV